MIIDEVNKFGLNLEKLSSLKSKFDEEGYRDYFLPHLNSISTSHSTTGETFNKKGKTDILIQNGTGEIEWYIYFQKIIVRFLYTLSYIHYN
ncbi:hypothetical protein ACNSOL_11735 (plasmid) [Aliarcobacter lanthieri]|uniref:hypothetical protein n=1 Tax=Aliarcobacter lanthieri TaxID=1355374 RepID=UPI003AAAA1A5